MYSIGNEQLLQENPIAIYCSREISSSVHQASLDLVQSLMSLPLTLAGGWQSTVEKDALKVRGSGSHSNIIYFLAKGIQNFKLPKSLRIDLDMGKVLIVSLWMQKERVDSQKVEKRDELMLYKLERFLFLNISKGGKLEELFYHCLDREKEVLLLDHPENQQWVNPKVILLSGKNATTLLS